jgi:hypothetical protein
VEGSLLHAVQLRQRRHLRPLAAPLCMNLLIESAKARRRRVDYMRGQRPPRLAGEEENGSRLHGLGLGILACAAAILRRKNTSWRRGVGEGYRATGYRVQGTCRLLWWSSS